MTEDEARQILIEQALDTAANKIEFLHGCLTDPQYEYAYPEMTHSFLEEVSHLIRERPAPCVHGRFDPACEGCVWGHRWRCQRYEARHVLGLE